jgi:hypothetical protein
MFNVVNKRDDVLDAADNDNRDDTNKKSIDNCEDTFDAAEDNGDDLDTNKTTPLDGFSFFFDTSTLTYRSFFQLQSSFVGWMCFSLSWFYQQMILRNEDV